MYFKESFVELSETSFIVHKIIDNIEYIRFNVTILVLFNFNIRWVQNIWQQNWQYEWWKRKYMLGCIIKHAILNTWWYNGIYNTNDIKMRPSFLFLFLFCNFIVYLGSSFSYSYLLYTILWKKTQIYFIFFLFVLFVFVNMVKVTVNRTFYIRTAKLVRYMHIYASTCHWQLSSLITWTCCFVCNTSYFKQLFNL